jgi:hypothetical protein
MANETTDHRAADVIYESPTERVQTWLDASTLHIRFKCKT